MDNDNLKIVCLGDSITYGFPHGPEYSWVKMLDDLIDGEAINCGINGNTTTDMLARFDRTVLRFNPTHLIIMGGINDVMCRESYDRITTNLRLMAERTMENGIQPIFGLPTAVDYQEFEKLLWRIRDWISEYAEQKSISLIDFCSAFYEKKRLREELLLADGGHPTVKGYQEMFKVIDLNIFK